MSWPRSFFYPHSVIIRAYVEGAGMGSSLADPVTSIAEVKDESQLIRTDRGDESTSGTQITLPLTAVVPLDSEVTVWSGTPAERTAVVIKVARDENPPPLPSHQIVYLE